MCARQVSESHVIDDAKGLLNRTPLVLFVSFSIGGLGGDEGRNISLPSRMKGSPVCVRETAGCKERGEEKEEEAAQEIKGGKGQGEVEGEEEEEEEGGEEKESGAK